MENRENKRVTNRGAKGQKLTNKLKKVIVLGGMIAGILGCTPSSVSYAAEANLQAKITQLQAKFPGGKYWNHVGSASDNVNGWTNKPCTCHGVSGVSHIYGTGGCTCNHYYDSVQTSHNCSTQCMGFANKLGYDVFGATKWYIYSAPTQAQLANVKVGDIVRYSSTDTSGHSVFVIAKNGYKVTVGEANYGGKCMISWTRTIDLSSPTVKVSYYEHASNYDTVVGSGETTTEAQTTTTQATTEARTQEKTTGETTTETQTSEKTTEQAVTETQEKATTETATETTASEKATTEAVPTTGWVKAADGIHYQYLQNGTILKKKWLTLSKKKYYLDEQGYRVTGLTQISNSRYYFNENGVMQKEKWVSVGENDYYVAGAGVILKSQWLYKNNVLVYVTGDGSVAKNKLVKIGSYTYYFNAKGKRSSGFKKYNDKYYYCNSKGIVQKKKWITKSGKTYYLQASGVRAQSKLVKIGKYRYYFNDKGYLVKKKNITYNGNLYKADKKGRCKKIGKAPVTNQE